MARMTPAEATAVNNVISYVAGTGEPIPDEVARALYVLANRAHNRLQSGWDEAAVLRHWPQAFPATEDGGAADPPPAEPTVTS